MAGDTHHTGIVGVIVGAVVLFVALSTIPFPICLSTLAASQDTLPFPEPAWVAPSPHDEPNLHDTMEADRVSGRRNILVLNRCHHVFHASCLASWFEYHQYRCPICQTSYFSE
ncbi:hypothetical protein BO79DRAFT_185337 [Aspergillus costaricaensis CBS 115574]|uniref:Uncharacterized protein n=1 Tax=Aspergillus costaricaensis CBS 115574 TaxID=1448317 RepID=A0ACD1IVZ5_9EURO|nr:hypothetical protein BO79DRAFT_185337 [Aspergillus costaricaensis CBS 115574]RAK94628.1 hypothetical protein BO79DRAFT_185337 [Aspergillus costaricaensis CBS 115574]